MKNVYSLLVLALLCSATSQAQLRPVSGQVRNEKNVPVPYASVKLKGDARGVSADENGNFSLQASGSDTLLITVVGYDPREIPVNGQQSFLILLSPQPNSLQEVVVTALGVNRQKRALGYSTQNMDAEQLTRGNNPNLATALQGKIAGLEVRPSSGMPGASAQVLIRGSRFFDANNAPLYVVDGLPVSSEPSFKVDDFGVSGADYSGRSIDINPNDIEAINVLKGQAAAALYGTRASNGAIIITTKKGSRQKKGKPVISVATNWQMDNISRLPDLQTRYAHGSGGVATHFGSLSWGPEIKDLANDPVYGGNVANAFNNNAPSAATQGKYWSPQKNAWVTPQVYNNVKDFFETGLTAANSINISQAGDMGNYSIGLSSANQQGIIRGSGMDRFNVKFAGDFNASPVFKTGVSALISNTSIDKMPSGNNSILFTVYGAPADYDLKGTPMAEAGNQYKQLNYRAGFENPYWGIQHNTFNETTRRVLGNTYFSYTPLQALNIRYQVGIDQFNTEADEVYELGSAFTSGATLNPIIPSPDAPSGGAIINKSFINNSFNSLLTITYNKKIRGDWTLNLLAGNEVNHNSQREARATGLGFTTGGWHNPANTAVQNYTAEKYESRTVGFFANAQVDWRDMVYLTLTGRNDIISTMPAGSRSFFYPSVSAAWIFSEMEPLKDRNFSGKLRASYAEVGAPGVFRDTVYVRHTAITGSILDGIQFPLAGVVGYRPSDVLYDPSIKPQNTVSLELGTELRFLDNRVGLDYTYVRQQTKRQIFSVPLAGSTGYKYIVKNSGEMTGTIHEATLLLTPVKNKRFEWNVIANFSKVVNKVKSLAPGVENISLGGFTSPQVRASIGYSYPGIYGSSYQRNEAGEILVDDEVSSDTYGMPLVGPETLIGQVTPKFLLGINNTFRYRSFRLSVLLDWKNGGQMYSGANQWIDRYGVSERTAGRTTDKLIVKGVKASTVTDNKGGEANDIEITGADNFEAYYFHLNNITEAHVYSTSFVKLREIALAVEIPQQVIKRARFIQSASLVLSARNILLWTAMPNFDPESSQGNGNMQGGIEYMSLPQTRSIGAGLNLTF